MRNLSPANAEKEPGEWSVHDCGHLVRQGRLRREVDAAAVGWWWGKVRETRDVGSATSIASSTPSR